MVVPIVLVHYGLRSKSSYMARTPVLIFNSKKIAGFIVVLITLSSAVALGLAAIITKTYLDNHR
jgi:hypothetical protein